MQGLKALLHSMASSFKDLLPIVLVVLFFQLVVLQEPLPNVLSILFGLLLVVLGLTFFCIWVRNGVISHR